MQCSELVCEITLNEVNGQTEKATNANVLTISSRRAACTTRWLATCRSVGRRRRRYVTADSRLQNSLGLSEPCARGGVGHEVVESCGILSLRILAGKLESVRHSSDRGFSKISLGSHWDVENGTGAPTSPTMKSPGSFAASLP